MVICHIWWIMIKGLQGVFAKHYINDKTNNLISLKLPHGPSHVQLLLWTCISSCCTIRIYIYIYINKHKSRNMRSGRVNWVIYTMHRCTQESCEVQGGYKRERERVSIYTRACWYYCARGANRARADTRPPANPVTAPCLQAWARPSDE